MRHKISSLELFRGLASLMVAGFHASVMLETKKYLGTAPWNGILRIGSSGVDFFFVLSGFIMLRIHRGDLGKPRQAVRFMLRRVWRIYPLYWLLTFSILISYLVMPSFGAGIAHGPNEILHSLLLLPGDQKMILRQSWTLQHEMLFYLMFALMILHLRIGLLVFAVWQIAVIAMTISGIGAESLYSRNGFDTAFDFFNVEFSFGMIAAYLAPRLPLRMKPALFTGSALLFGWAYGSDIFLVRTGETTAHYLGFFWLTIVLGLASALLIAGCAIEGEGEPVRENRRWVRVMLWLGALSYPLYLAHEAVYSLGLKLAIQKFPHVPVALIHPLLVLSAVIAAFGLTILVERPVARLGKRIEKRLPAGRAIAETTGIG